LFPTSGGAIGLVMLLILVIAVSLFAVAIARRVQAAHGPHHVALCALMLVALLISKKSYTTYLVTFWIPMCFVIVRSGLTRNVVLLFSALSVVATLEPALWFDWLGQATLSRAWVHAAERGATYGFTLAAFIACELALLAGYLWLLRLAWTGAQRSSARPDPT